MPSQKLQEHRVSWRKGDLIGTGANGRVYLGLEEDTGAIIAVKEVMFTKNAYDLEERAQMQEEIELLRSLQHPNIVTYLGTDVCDNNHTLYIFTEWVPGGSIQALVNKFGRLSEAIVRKYLAQLLVGLGYLHDQQVIHRDIKAANILVDDRGTIKLADFGSSKRIGSMELMSNHNHSLRGTPYFMAPEVIMQTGHGYKADIWSVGCTILQMVTGQPPWKSLKLGSPAALMFHIANAEAPPPLPPVLSSDLETLLLATFSRDTRKRPTASELLRHPFVEAYSVATEAIAAGTQSLLERSTASQKNVQCNSTSHVSNVEEAADRTLACQATGLLCDDSESTRGFQLESFRMPNDETSNLSRLEICRPITSDSKIPEPVICLEDEALVTMFISKEAAAQFAGADKQFPGRPPSARPRGVPPRTSGPEEETLCEGNRDKVSRRIGAKSPLLMAQLPPRKLKHSFQEQKTSIPGRNVERQLTASSCYPAAGNTSAPEREHEDRPIITKAARRERDETLKSLKRRAAQDREKELKNEQFQRELKSYQLQLHD